MKAVHKSGSLVSGDALNYIAKTGIRLGEIHKALIKETQELGTVSMMQISPEQGEFITMLTKLMNCKKIIEVGTFTGYSALCFALGLPEGGRITCCDISKEWTNIGKKYWEKAGVASKIDLKIAPALETLEVLVKNEPNTFDMAFIDADKTNYKHYYENILQLLRSGGCLLIDNVLWSGKVYEEGNEGDASTTALRELNNYINKDERVEVVMIPLGDGVSIVRKK